MFIMWSYWRAWYALAWCALLSHMASSESEVSNLHMSAFTVDDVIADRFNSIAQQAEVPYWAVLVGMPLNYATACTEMEKGVPIWTNLTTDHPNVMYDMFNLLQNSPDVDARWYALNAGACAASRLSDAGDKRRAVEVLLNLLTYVHGASITLRRQVGAVAKSVGMIGVLHDQLDPSIRLSQLVVEAGVAEPKLVIESLLSKAEYLHGQGEEFEPYLFQALDLVEKYPSDVMIMVSSAFSQLLRDSGKHSDIIDRVVRQASRYSSSIALDLATADIKTVQPSNEEAMAARLRMMGSLQALALDYGPLRAKQGLSGPSTTWREHPAQPLPTHLCHTFSNHSCATPLWLHMPIRHRSDQEIAQQLHPFSASPALVYMSVYNGRNEVPVRRGLIAGHHAVSPGMRELPLAWQACDQRLPGEVAEGVAFAPGACLQQTNDQIMAASHAVAAAKDELSAAGTPAESLGELLPALPYNITAGAHIMASNAIKGFRNRNLLSSKDFTLALNSLSKVFSSAARGAAALSPRLPRKLHVCIAYQQIFLHSVTKMIGRVLATLPRSYFRVTLIHPSAPNEPTTTWLFSQLQRQNGDGNLFLPFSGTAARSGVQDARDKVWALECDVMIYPELGMSTDMWWMAMSRLAPVVIASHGHSTTSGYDGVVDYWVSMDPSESPDLEVGSAQYAEQLVRFNATHAPFLAQSAPPPQPPQFRPENVEVPPEAFAGVNHIDFLNGQALMLYRDDIAAFSTSLRPAAELYASESLSPLEAAQARLASSQPVRFCATEFNITADNWAQRKRVYLVPQFIFKLAPMYDSAITWLAIRDPCAEVLLLRGSQASASSVLYQRLSASLWDTLGALNPQSLQRIGASKPEYFAYTASRIRFVPQRTASEFMNMISMPDVMMDLWPFGGCTTTMEALLLGTPVVSMPAASALRGRFTLPFLRAIGHEDWLVHNLTQLVDTTLEVGMQRWQARWQKHELPQLVSPEWRAQQAKTSSSAWVIARDEAANHEWVRLILRATAVHWRHTADALHAAAEEASKRIGRRKTVATSAAMDAAAQATEASRADALSRAPNGWPLPSLLLALRPISDGHAAATLAFGWPKGAEPGAPSFVDEPPERAVVPRMPWDPTQPPALGHLGALCLSLTSAEAAVKNQCLQTKDVPAPTSASNNTALQSFMDQNERTWVLHFSVSLPAEAQTGIVRGSLVDAHGFALGGVAVQLDRLALA